MVDLDEFADELATELMLDAARKVDRLRIENTVGGHEDLAGLSDAEYEEFLDMVLDRIEHADITIDLAGG